MGRVAKWAIELAAHTIQYKPRTTIKSQIIADFFADWGEHQYLPPAPDSTHRRMNFNGSKMLEGLGAGVILTSPKGDKLQLFSFLRCSLDRHLALGTEPQLASLKMIDSSSAGRVLCVK
jgi:hypothetical protein